MCYLKSLLIRYKDSRLVCVFKNDRLLLQRKLVGVNAFASFLSGGLTTNVVASTRMPAEYNGGIFPSFGLSIKYETPSMCLFAAACFFCNQNRLFLIKHKNRKITRTEKTRADK